MMKHWQNGLAAAGTLLLVALTPARAEDPPGVLWETTSQMVMPGMPMSMPANTVKLCTAKEWKEAPGGMDERQKCHTSDFKMVGSKATWKMTCAGPPAMTGDGEIIRDGDNAYTGKITFNSEQGAMTIMLAGKRLGVCDPSKK